jgi:hypothetical protein
MTVQKYRVCRILRYEDVRSELHGHSRPDGLRYMAYIPYATSRLLVRLRLR